MRDIIKTLESWRNPKEILNFFKAPKDHVFMFSLGRGRPKRDIAKLWFVHRGRVLGYLSVITIDRRMPETTEDFELDRTLDDACGQAQTWKIKLGTYVAVGHPETWKIKLGAYVAVCRPQIHRLRARIYYQGFRGWRYFNLGEYSQRPEASWNF